MSLKLVGDGRLRKSTKDAKPLLVFGAGGVPIALVKVLSQVFNPVLAFIYSN